MADRNKEAVYSWLLGAPLPLQHRSNTSLVTRDPVVISNETHLAVKELGGRVALLATRSVHHYQGDQLPQQH